MIRIDSLSHAYPGQHSRALNDLSLELRTGSITGVLGPNGSGKTTLFKTIGGRLAPESGTILLEGEAATREDLVAHCLYVGDDRDLHSTSAKSALRYARLRPTWDETTFARLAERFALSLKGSLGRRSLGQRSAFTSCLALAAGAPITLLDEPFANLDVPTRLALAEEIIAVSAQSDGERTILISSHLVSELESLIERVVVLDRGRILNAMPAEELRTAVLALIGDPQAIRELLSAEAEVQILEERPLGRLAELRITGHSRALVDAARARGIEIQPLSFQDAFVSLISKEK